jgi:hypothetical protein
MARNFGIGLAVVGVVLLIWGGMEWKLASASSAQPETTSLKQLIARGPNGNANIVLTDFHLCQNIVVTTRGSTWENVWIPVVPVDEVPPGVPDLQPSRVRALIFSIKVRNEADIARRCDQPRLPALVTNKITSLGSKEKQLLEQKYPGTDWSTCLIIQEGREPFSRATLGLLLGGGGLSAVAGAGLLILSFVQSRNETASRPKRKKRRPAEEDDEDDEPRPSRRRAADGADDDLPRPRRRQAEEEDDDEPRRPRRRRADEE